MDESKLLAALLRSRKAWERTSNVLTIADFSAKGARLYDEITTFYEQDNEATTVDTEILAGRLAASIPNESQRNSLVSLVDDLSKMDVAANSVATYALEVRRRNVGFELAQLLLKGSKKDKVVDKLDQYYQLLESEGLENLHETEARPAVSALTERRDTGHRIKILPGALNRRLNGGALPGHHIVIYARPEIGKSLLAINIAAGAIRRGYRVLWVENEDNIDDLWQRFYSRLALQPEPVLRQHPERYEELLTERGIDNLFIYEAKPGSIYELKAKIEEHKPQILIVNQIRNLNIKSESRTNQLEAAAQAVRNLGKEYKMVTISVTQAGESAENKAYLDMGDVDYSNTGIPSTADLMIGIGADENMKKWGTRMINLPKNKISGKHESFSVTFDNLLSRVESSEGD